MCCCRPSARLRLELGADRRLLRLGRLPPRCPSARGRARRPAPARKKPKAEAAPPRRTRTTSWERPALARCVGNVCFFLSSTHMTCGRHRPAAPRRLPGYRATRRTGRTSTCASSSSSCCAGRRSSVDVSLLAIVLRRGHLALVAGLLLVVVEVLLGLMHTRLAETGPLAVPRAERAGADAATNPLRDAGPRALGMSPGISARCSPCRTSRSPCATTFFLPLAVLVVSTLAHVP